MCMRRTVAAHLGAESLRVGIEDASFENAAFVGRLPNLRTLEVEGEAFLPGGVLDFGRLRGLKRIAVGGLSFESCLFLGAALSGGEHTLRMSSGHCVALPPLRSRERINLNNKGLKDGDLAVLLGALSLNRFLRELDLFGNPAPAKDGVKAAMVQSLPWELLRNHSLRPGALLDGCKEESLLLPEAGT